MRYSVFINAFQDLSLFSCIFSPYKLLWIFIVVAVQNLDLDLEYLQPGGGSDVNNDQHAT